MLCEKCNEREANIEYTEIINGVKTTHHYCMQCVAEMQMDFGNMTSQLFEGDFSLSKLLSSILSMKVGGDKAAGEYPKIVCPTCRTSYEEFINKSRFGCPDCYNVFDLLIGENMRQLHGSEMHKGKRPKYTAEGVIRTDVPEPETPAEVPVQDGTEEKLLELRALLKKAIASEEYEEAARCRDEIKKLEAVKAAGESGNAAADNVTAETAAPVKMRAVRRSAAGKTVKESTGEKKTAEKATADKASVKKTTAKKTAEKKAADKAAVKKTAAKKTESGKAEAEGSASVKKPARRKKKEEDHE